MTSPGQQNEDPPFLILFSPLGIERKKRAELRLVALNHLIFWLAHIREYYAFLLFNAYLSLACVCSALLSHCSAISPFLFVYIETSRPTGFTLLC